MRDVAEAELMQVLDIFEQIFEHEMSIPCLV